MGKLTQRNVQIHHLAAEGRMHLAVTKVQFGFSKLRFRCANSRIEIAFTSDSVLGPEAIHFGLFECGLDGEVLCSRRSNRRLRRGQSLLGLAHSCFSDETPRTG